MERGTSRKAGLRLFFFQKFGRPFFSKNDEEKYQAEYIALVSSDITAQAERITYASINNYHGFRL